MPPEMSLKFWRWAHHRAEALWHWIYYNRLPEGRDFKRRSTAAQQQGIYCKIELLNSKGEPVTVPTLSGSRVIRTIRPQDN